MVGLVGEEEMETGGDWWSWEGKTHNTKRADGWMTTTDVEGWMTAECLDATHEVIHVL